MGLLETLRYLNKENINNNPKLRDEFFKSLIVCDDNAPDYLHILSDIYYEEFRKQFKESELLNYHLSDIFCKEIKKQLTDNTMNVEKNEISIKAKNSAYAVTYVGSVKGMKKIIEQEPQHFDFFKENLLMGLITRYCNEIIKSVKNKEKLNEVVSIYAEHTRHLSSSKNIDMIIDQEFIDELKKTPYVDTKSCWLAIHRLLDRAYPRKVENSYYDDKFNDSIYNLKKSIR